MKWLIYIILVNVLLFSCTMAPKYERPALPVVNEWQSKLPKNISEEAELSLNHLVWEAFFVDEGLKATIQTALENNKNLREAVLNADAARALYRMKKSDAFPVLNADVTGSRKGITEKASSTGNKHITSSYDANINLSYEIDLFGRIRSLSKAAEEDFLSLEETRRAVQVSLIGETAMAYLTWVYDCKAEVLTNEILQSIEKQYQIAQDSYKTGVLSKVELVQSESLVVQARANSVQARKKIELDINALTLLQGENFEQVYDKNVVKRVFLVEDKHLSVGLPSDVLLVRPDILAAEHKLLSMNANIGAVRAAYFPKLSLTAALGFSSIALKDLFTGGAAGAWNFAPKLTAPLFEFGGNKTALKYSKANKEVAIVRYEKAIQMAFKEVNDELVNRQALAELLQEQKKLEQTSKETYDLINKKVENGLTRVATAIDSQKIWLQAQIALNEMQKQSQLNLVMIYKVLGGGCE